MKLFTGSLAAGLVLLAGGAQAQVPGPYENGRPPYTAASDFGAPYAVGTAAGSRAATTHPGRATEARPKPAAVDGSLFRAPR